MPRILDVFQAVVKQGPASLNEIYPAIKRSRSAAYRALNDLVAAGWVRTTVSGHQYVATSVVDDLASHCAASSVDLDVVCRLLTKHHKDHSIAIQVGLYATTRSFFLIECSEDKNAMNIELRPDENELACAAYSMLPRPDRPVSWKSVA
ncbi:hypothetical protein HW561_16465 [Rhodobacteraceae bacterium B1Z28]|uniref:Transcription regulator TrmB N-terminal domain-containing protein n=1 Tax=Ruegeria haliotis TaxID=2747601 RepID=A0ABX2PT81_9RHOB|nr:helix-turn-helix domain-containing protein [Ruegeria haliotis]NVO57390.1 hypothetical protein [Ruegeria haliotis]